MDSRMMRGVVVGLVALAAGSALAADAFMGDWEGTRGKEPICAQVIAWGDGKYQANILAKFDTRDPHLAVLQGVLDGERVAFTGKGNDKGPLKGSTWAAVIEKDAFTGSYKGDASATFEMKKIERLSPTLGAKPPDGAIVLFDGTQASLANWQQRNGQPIRWKLDEDEKSMTIRGGGIISKHKFADHQFHIEFRTPFKPKARGQGRGNSGCYFQGRYEVQVLDSYGLEGRDNECGGIYSIGPPRVNMCAPPLQWQTYDVVFYAPRVDADGKKIKNGVITVRHNGVLIHENREVTHPTTAHWGGDVKEPNGLHIQDHGNPVSYRNIWAVELKGDEKAK